MFVVTTSEEIYAFPETVTSVWYKKRQFFKRVEVAFSDGGSGYFRVNSDSEGEIVVLKIVDAIRKGEKNVNITTKTS